MKFMTISQYSKHSNFPVSRIRTMIGNGAIIASKLGGIWYINLEATEEMLATKFSPRTNSPSYAAVIRARMRKAVENL